MQFVTAKVLKGKTVVAERVEACLAVSDAAGGEEWNGTFELPHDAEIAEGKGYRIELADGRAADIRITNVNRSDHGPTTVGFRSAGA